MTKTEKTEDKYSSIRNELNLSIETSNFERAIILCKKLLFFLPSDIQTYSILADMYIKSYDLSSAITCLKKILLISPNSPETIFKLHQLLLSNVQYQYIILHHLTLILLDIFHIYFLLHLFYYI